MGSCFCIILFSYSSSLCCKTFEKNLRQKKKLQGKKSSSSKSLVDTKLSPRDHACTWGIFVISAFSCRGPGFIKQTLNYSFCTIQYTCFVISSIMSKLCLLFRPNVAWTDGTNLSLIDEVAMIKWVENYISQTSLVTYVFYCTFQVTLMWRTIEKSLKKILRQLLLLRNHLKLPNREFKEMTTATATSSPQFDY